MSEQKSRLLRCFASVFPTLSGEEIQSVNTESLGIWDSLSTVTLVAVVQEEFNIEITSDLIPQLTSFDAFLNYLEPRSLAGQSSRHQ